MTAVMVQLINSGSLSALLRKVRSSLSTVFTMRVVKVSSTAENSSAAEGGKSESEEEEEGEAEPEKAEGEEEEEDEGEARRGEQEELEELLAATGLASESTNSRTKRGTSPVMCSRRSRRSSSSPLAPRVWRLEYSSNSCARNSNNQISINFSRESLENLLGEAAKQTNVELIGPVLVHFPSSLIVGGEASNDTLASR